MYEIQSYISWDLLKQWLYIWFEYIGASRIRHILTHYCQRPPIGGVNCHIWQTRNKIDITIIGTFWLSVCTGFQKVKFCPAQRFGLYRDVAGLYSNIIETFRNLTVDLSPLKRCSPQKFMQFREDQKSHTFPKNVPLVVIIFCQKW